MLTKRQIKYINSLQQKKFRKEHQCFLVQGTKSVLELITFSEVEVELLVISQEFSDKYQNELQSASIDELVIAKPKELERLGTFDSNSMTLAVVKMRKEQTVSRRDNEFVLVLDDIRDPGNLGTIIRIADWYGVKHIVCTPTTADMYNPKVVAATMGSFLRVNLVYTDVLDYLKTQKDVFVGGALLNGEEIYKVKGHEKGGVIVIGNESKGISEEVQKLITHKITIPRIGEAESLNAGIATAIFCDNLIGRK